VTPEQALSITTGLSTFFDRRPWTAEKIRFFAQAIEDLNYDCAREAAERYMRDGEYAPVPRDIREIARTITPKRALLPPQLDRDGWPVRYHRDDDDAVKCTPGERAVLNRTYARARRETREALEKQWRRDKRPLSGPLQDAIERLRTLGDVPPF
jgi:hypothetical protein